ncbi:MAG TPA: hypothetical protein VFL57_21055 [Bryobacteraceae bacterium]|nr:hypothetical protein [Bryobacteraceae bacterium]
MHRLLCIAACTAAFAADFEFPRWHLTARQWQRLGIAREHYLDVMEGVCRFSSKQQAPSGAIIDPFLRREHQYATPYFAYAVGTLMHEGRARDLWQHGVRAMEHATACFGRGRNGIPDQHGECFIPALTAALPLYEAHVPDEQWARWRDRLTTPRAEIVGANYNNWETYAMKGEWMRAIAGLAGREAAIEGIERSWRERQRLRIAAAPWLLYHDRTSDPDTLNVEAVGRGNLLALIHLGYSGPSAPEIRRIVEHASRLTLLVQDPTGQAPAHGRTDDHVWVDVGYQLAFEVMAERTRAADSWLAAVFRRAAVLAFTNIQRWRRSGGDWAGLFFVARNRFDPALRVGYQNASQYSNYNGSLMMHLAEAFHARRSAIAESPAPAEIGGYALRLDDEFAGAFANAGGMQIQAKLRGQVNETHGNYWTPFGVVRFSRVGWDSRLGPSDGALTRDGGVSFAPTFLEQGKWLRMADLSARYHATWSVAFVHPLLVRCSLLYAPKPGQSGPSFHNDFIVTPDGVLSTIIRTAGEVDWGVTWPILENDGRPLDITFRPTAAATKYSPGPDQQVFLAVAGSYRVQPDERSLRSTYGDLRPVRVVAAGASNHTFVYPRSDGEPSVEAVAADFAVRPRGYTSRLARVEGSLYIGRTSAGGYGGSLDLDGDGAADVSFSADCAFVLQLRDRRITAMETDREVIATARGRQYPMRPYRPMSLPRQAR